MRIAVIADIHGNDLALDAVLEDIKGQSVEAIFNLGDLFSGPLNAGKVAETLLRLDLPCVRGNHDRYLIEQSVEAMGLSDSHAFDQLAPEHLDYIRRLPQTLTWRDEFFLCHATPERDDVYWFEEVSRDGTVRRKGLDDIENLAAEITCPVILCAHSHIAAMVRLSDGRLVVNPGSVGCPAYDDTHPYPHKMEVGHPMANYAILEKSGGACSVDFRSVPYDHIAMASLALGNGRADWASGLARGWLE